MLWPAERKKSAGPLQLALVPAAVMVWRCVSAQGIMGKFAQMDK